MEQVLHHFVEFSPHKITKTWSFDHSTPTSNKDKSCPYNVNTTSTRKVMTIEKNITWGLLVDPIPSSPDLQQKNYMAKSNKNY